MKNFFYLLIPLLIILVSVSNVTAGDKAKIDGNIPSGDIIIDSHVHFGKIMDWDMDKKDVIAYLDTYNVAFAVVSNVAAAEFDHNLLQIEDSQQIGQIKANQEAVDFAKEYPNKIRVLFWIKPHLEGYSKEVENFIKANRKYICGIKVHPYHSNLKFNVENYKGYLEMCKRLKLPMVVHTDGSDLCSPKNVYEVAKLYPDVNFIMVHMGLGTDHLDAIEYLKKLPNLYGDTTWVDSDSVLLAVKEAGSKKILFGTDAIINGVDTFAGYKSMIEILKENLSNEDYANIFSKNSKRIFGI